MKCSYDEEVEIVTANSALRVLRSFVPFVVQGCAMAAAALLA
jgi:hypothetical protein